jgi:hypothetical protein
MSEIFLLGEWLGITKGKLSVVPLCQKLRTPYLISKLPDPLVPCLNMGRSQSKKTPLQCMLKNFTRGYTSDYNVELTPQKLWKFCQIDWMFFKVGWPSKGFLDGETICNVYQVVTGMSGHPDQPTT